MLVNLSSDVTVQAFTAFRWCIFLLANNEVKHADPRCDYRNSMCQNIRFEEKQKNTSLAHRSFVKINSSERLRLTRRNKLIPTTLQRSTHFSTVNVENILNTTISGIEVLFEFIIILC